LTLRFKSRIDNQAWNEITLETYFRIKNSVFFTNTNKNETKTEEEANKKIIRNVDVFIKNIKEIALCNEYTPDPQKKLDKCSSYLFTSESNPEVVIHFRENLNNVKFNIAWLMPNGKKNFEI